MDLLSFIFIALFIALYLIFLVSLFVLVEVDKF